LRVTRPGLGGVSARRRGFGPTSGGGPRFALVGGHEGGTAHHRRQNQYRPRLSHACTSLEECRFHTSPGRSAPVFGHGTVAFFSGQSNRRGAGPIFAPPGAS